MKVFLDMKSKQHTNKTWMSMAQPVNNPSLLTGYRVRLVHSLGEDQLHDQCDQI